MAKKTVRKIFGARLLAPNGSLIFCESCEKLVGSINKTGYKYINIVFICTCGNCGSIEIVRDGHFNDPAKPIGRMPKTKLGVCTCSNCDTQMLSMINDRIQNYSFYAECVCGEKYDTKPGFDKRLGETLKAFKKLKKE